MPRQTVVRPFKPFDLQHQGAAEPMYIDIQECVYYVESQVRAIIAAILITAQANWKWMQLYLQAELVSLIVFNCSIK